MRIYPGITHTSCAAVLGFLLLIVSTTTAQAKPCFWLFNSTEGIQSLFTLEPRWAAAACPSNRFTYTVTSANGNTARFTSIRYPILEFTPAVTDLSSSAVRYEHVDINVVCDAFTPLCDWATVYFVVRPAPPPVKPVVCHPLPDITVEFGQHGATRLMPYIENCAEPEIRITKTHGPSGAAADDIFAIHIHRNEPWLAFDPEETNKQEGHYDATLEVDCGGSSCTFSQDVTAVPQSIVPTPSCNRDYGFRASFGARMHESIVLHDEDVALCPYGTSAKFTFETTKPPQYNPQEFTLDHESGEFAYHAPEGPGVKQDGFTFVLRCIAAASATAEVHELCIGHAALLITAAPPPPTLPQCPGDFQFTYTLANGGAAIERQTFALHDRAARGGDGGDVGGAVRFCPSGEFTSALITVPPLGGVLSEWDATSGRFVYQANHPALGDNRDRFNFTLGCADTTTRCTGTATLSIVGARDDRPVYHAWQDTIVCRGTCDAAAWKSSPAFAGAAFFDDGASPVPGVAHVTPRKDGRATDELSFEFTADGELLIRAYTTIGNMAARFVTFTPLAPADGAGLLTSSCVPLGSHVSFNASCLDRQATDGSAASVWTWTDPALLVGHVNLLTGAYKSGNNYYQKFGGKHRACDIFRDDPCQYAPMLTPPTRHVEAGGGIHWTLYINDCDATWVGRATVETLRAMRQPDGQPTFTLVSGNHLRGTVYSQAVKPADWSAPGGGVVSSTRAYDMLLSIRNIVDIDTVKVDAHGDVELGSDVVVHSGRVTATNERLFVYSLLLYPYENHAGSIVNVNTSLVTLSAIQLLNASWTSPNAVECPHCTGTRSLCYGTGNNIYETDCGADSLMTFTPLSGFDYKLDNPPEMDTQTDFVPSTSLADRNMYNVTFGVRANGKDSATSADASPVGVFYLRLTLSTGHSFVVTVNQTDYISQINTRFIDMEMCRASAYWPVPDPLHDSLPVRPYKNPINNTNDKADAFTFDAPEPLTPPATCRNAITDPSNDKDNTVVLNRRTSTVQVGNTTILVSMCAMADVYTFGVTDWVSLSLPFSTQEAEPDAAATTAKLQYLVLSVRADEAVPFDSLQVTDDALVHILLDGTAPPERVTDEVGRWMGGGGATATPTTGTTYYPWKTHASSLNYRRILFVHDDTGATEPFHFAFTPGSLLSVSSNVRVHMALSASVLFTSGGGSAAAKDAAVGGPQSREEKFMYILTVSRSTSSAIRFDTDAYAPKFVTISTPGLGRKSATALLIVLIIGVIVVLAGSIYVEVTYKRIIHNAKYHPRRPDSAVGVHYGRDGKPRSTSPGISPRAELGGDHASAAAAPTTAAAVTTIKTSFGTVQLEQRRVPHDDASEQNKAGVADDTTTPLAGDTTARHLQDCVKPPIGEEQVRVVSDDDEVAEF